MLSRFRVEAFEIKRFSPAAAHTLKSPFNPFFKILITGSIESINGKTNDMFKA